MRLSEDINYNTKDIADDNLSYNIEDVIEIPEIIDVAVISIRKLTAKEAFGEKAIRAEQEVLFVEFENAEYNVRFHEYFNFYEKRKVPKNSKLGKYLNRYKELNLGKTAKAVINNNYWEILLI